MKKMVLLPLLILLSCNEPPLRPGMSELDCRVFYTDNYCMMCFHDDGDWAEVCVNVSKIRMIHNRTVYVPGWRVTAFEVPRQLEQCLTKCNSVKYTATQPWEPTR
jgi:hypothetical protein